ncbi:MAG TPA: HAMP domain-containing histidine kinase [Caldithrix abyssi]|uniref:histidine kinase n=1 Tax=Caldithrix abyssi TaxID=187145 RepID=A0A7V1LK06_CALAY|nr:HAMP domain-containing histidine kinase [Caldithrix abyssi]
MIIEIPKLVLLSPEPEQFQMYLDTLRDFRVELCMVNTVEEVLEKFTLGKYEMLMVHITPENENQMDYLIGHLGIARETTLLLGIYRTARPGPDKFDFLLNMDDYTHPQMIKELLQGILSITQKVKAQTDLSAMLIHDMRSPLQSILSYTELLQNGVFGELNKGQMQMLGNSLRLTDTLLELMSELGDVLRFENKSFHIRPTVFPIKTLLQDVIQAIWIQADKKNIKFSFSGASDENFDILADRMALFRVLSNLLTNAVQYSPQNSVIRIEIGRSYNGDAPICFYIRITDSGPGISEEETQIIFDKFYRVHSGSAKKGFGLGLYVARLFIEAHKGKIRVNNNREGGCTFHISIPFGKSPE